MPIIRLDKLLKSGPEGNLRKIIQRAQDMDDLTARLRGKLEDDPAHPRFILTVRSKGYMLVGQEEAA